MERKGLFLILAVILLISCSKNTESIFRITSFVVGTEGTSPPFNSDVRTFTVVDTAETTWVSYADPAIAYLEYDVSFNDPSGVPITGYAVNVEKYRVSFERIDGGTGVPETHEGVVNQVLKCGECPTGVVFVLVPIDAKLNAPLDTLTLGGAIFHTKAIVDFWATEVKSGSELQATGEIQVNFSDWPD